MTFMKITRRFALMLALVAIAIGIGVYIYATLFFRERLHVLVITLALCCLGVVLGYIVTRPNMQAVSVGLTMLGIVALSIGFNLASLDFHRRAYVVLGLGAFGILCGLAGIIIIQVKSRAVSRSS